MTTSGDGPGCDEAGCGHGRDRLADELRAVALLALDRLDPLLARLRNPSPDGAPCPLCGAPGAARSEPARRLAEHAVGLVGALRDALAEPGASPAPPPARPVQHIPVEREPGGARC